MAKNGRRANGRIDLTRPIPRPNTRFQPPRPNPAGLFTELRARGGSWRGVRREN